MEVVRVNWPQQAALLAEAREKGWPRLIVVEGSELPRMTGDPLEDFVMSDVPETLRAVRCSVLATRALRRRTPVAIGDGMVSCGGRTVALSPTEFGLLRALADREGAVVRRDVLADIVWPGEDVDRNVVDVALGRLRRRIDGMGVSIRTVRSRGYVLELSESCQIVESEP
jgi:two-component system OmpR family response regulator